MTLSDLANIATILGLVISTISLIISGITLKLAFNIKINVNKDRNNNITKNTISDSTINQIKG